MGSDIETTLRRRMYATIALYAVCAVAFLGTLAALYLWVVPSLIGWWGREYALDSQVGLAAVVVVAGVLVWLTVGTVRNFYASPLDETNAQAVTEDDYPDLHATVRRLAQQADVPAPSISVVPSDVPNAYTAGVTPERSTIVVSEGLLEALDADERQAVLAHELAHISNRDGALMSIGYLLPAATFAVAKALTSPLESNERPEGEPDYDKDYTLSSDDTADEYADGETGRTPSSQSTNSHTHVFVGGSSHGSGGSFDAGDNNGGGGGIIVAILVLIAILVLTVVLTLAIATFFWVFSYLTLLLLARTREYAADWGALELTGDADALVNALTELDDEMDGVPLEDLREVDGAVETLYFMPLRRGAFRRRDVMLLSDDLFPNTHPDTQQRIDRVLDAAENA